MPGTPGVPPSSILQLVADAPLAIDANYEYGVDDRRYQDSQILGVQALILQALLLGIHATWITLDASSPTVAQGDGVCTANSAAGTVTRATATALAAAGSVAGIVLVAAAPGAKILVALHGVLPPSVTGLPTSGGSPQPVRITSGRCQAVASLSAGDYAVGTIDDAGFLTLAPIAPTVGGSGSASQAPESIARVNATGAGGAHASPYTASPQQTVVVDTSLGAVQVNLPALTLGQWVDVLPDADTAMSNACTISGAGTNISQPPPNEGTFSATYVIAASSNNLGESLRFINAGSAGGYSVK